MIDLRSSRTYVDVRHAITYDSPMNDGQSNDNQVMLFDDRPPIFTDVHNDGDVMYDTRSPTTAR